MPTKSNRIKLLITLISEVSNYPSEALRTNVVRRRNNLIVGDRPLFTAIKSNH